MSHIIHLLGPHLSVRLTCEHLAVYNKKTKTERTVPMEDIAVLICAAPDASFTAGALRRLAELNVPVLHCNERFEPSAMTVPYHRATETELLRAQAAWTPPERDALFRCIITAKVANQAANLNGKTSEALHEIAKRCERGKYREPDEPRPGKSIANVTASRRELVHADTPSACESRAARLYWRRIIPPLSQRVGSKEVARQPGTRQGINGMLDYGYAILRSTVLRALAARGFIAALGLHHTARAGTFALADDLMEPLRPFMDRKLASFVLSSESVEMAAWMRESAALLLKPVRMPAGQVRLIHAVDAYIQSFATAVLRRECGLLRIPKLEPESEA